MGDGDGKRWNERLSASEACYSFFVGGLTGMVDWRRTGGWLGVCGAWAAWTGRGRGRIGDGRREAGWLRKDGEGFRVILGRVVQRGASLFSFLRKVS